VLQSAEDIMSELTDRLRAASASAAAEAGYDDDWADLLAQWGDDLEDAGVIACIEQAGHHGNLALDLAEAAETIERLERERDGRLMSHADPHLVTFTPPAGAPTIAGPVVHYWDNQTVPRAER
jgi:hypothetical protein